MPTKTPLAALARAILPDAPSLASDIASAEADPVEYWRAHREEFRSWGIVSAKGGHIASSAFLMGLGKSKALGQLDWKDGAGEVRFQVTTLLRAFEPAAKRPKLPTTTGDASHALTACDEALASVGLCLVQLDNGSDQTFLVLVPTSQRRTVLTVARAAKGFRASACTNSEVREAALGRPAPKAKKTAAKKAAKAISRRSGGRPARRPSAKHVARARAKLAEATKHLAAPKGWHESAHFNAACALVVLGESAKARRHVEALVGLYARRRSIDVSLYTIPHLAAAALVEPAKVAAWAKRLKSAPAYQSLLEAIPRVFAGVRPFPRVDARRLSGGNERAYGRVFSALAAGTKAKILEALDEFDDRNFAGGHQNPIINACVVASGLPLDALPPTIVERMWPGFSPLA